MGTLQDSPDSHVQEETDDPIQRRTVLAVVAALNQPEDNRMRGRGDPAALFDCN